MVDKMSADKLGKYSSQICGALKKNTSDSQAMLDDMQRIIDELVTIINGQQLEIDALHKAAERDKLAIAEKEEALLKRKQKDEAYANLEIDAVQIASMLKAVEDKNDLLNRGREQLQKDRDRFEEEKQRIIFEKDEALSKKQKAEADTNQANASRDRAIKERDAAQREVDDLNKKLDNYQDELMEYDQRCTQYEDDIKWYKDYAAATDKKIMDFYEKRDRKALDNHFYEYLNNEDKIEEIRVRFHEFKMAPDDANQNETRESTVNNYRNTELMSAVSKV